MESDARLIFDVPRPAPGGGNATERFAATPRRPGPGTEMFIGRELAPVPPRQSRPSRLAEALANCGPELHAMVEARQAHTSETYVQALDAIAAEATREEQL